MKEYFVRLYLSENATHAEVKAAYRKLAKKFHPDKNIESNDFEEEFKLIQEAYDILNAHFSKKSSEPKQSDQNTSTTTNYSETSSKNEKPTTEVGSRNHIDNGTLYRCVSCNKKFWADKTKQKVWLCPFCFNINFLNRGNQVDIKQVNAEHGRGKNSYNCGNCKKVFYVDRTKGDTTFCPHCQALNTLPDLNSSDNLKRAFDYFFPGSQRFDCANCKNVFYADRAKVKNVICPYCQTTCILPNIFSNNIKRAVSNQVPGTQHYECGYCKKGIYADRSISDTVICPHCGSTITLPDINSSENIKTASARFIPGTQRFQCFKCKKVFYTDSVEGETVICPHCKTTCNLPHISTPPSQAPQNGCGLFTATIIFVLGSLISIFTLLG